MSKQGILMLLLGIALGVNAVLIGLVVNPPDQVAVGQSANGTNGYLMASGVLQGRGTAEAIFIFDTNSRKLAVYFQNNKSLELLSVRDIQYDLMPQDFSLGGRQNPPVSDMKKRVSGKD